MIRQASAYEYIFREDLAPIDVAQLLTLDEIGYLGLRETDDARREKLRQAYRFGQRGVTPFVSTITGEGWGIVTFSFVPVGLRSHWLNRDTQEVAREEVKV